MSLLEKHIALFKEIKNFKDYNQLDKEGGVYMFISDKQIPRLNEASCAKLVSKGVRHCEQSEAICIKQLCIF